MFTRIGVWKSAKSRTIVASSCFDAAPGRAISAADLLPVVPMSPDTILQYQYQYQYKYQHHRALANFSVRPDLPKSSQTLQSGVYCSLKNDVGGADISPIMM
jgi:hypothetical protein